MMSLLEPMIKIQVSVMKLVFNFQLGHTQTVYATYKYIPYKYIHTSHSQITSCYECRNLHTRVIKLTGMKSIWRTNLPIPCRQTNDDAHKYMTDIRVWEIVCEPGWAVWQKSVLQEASLEIQHCRLQSKIQCGEMGAGNIQITVSSQYFCECRGCNNLWMTFCLHWGNGC